ncbi:MAG: M3 family metallopeptidase [Pseudomonadales bacterium]
MTTESKSVQALQTLERTSQFGSLAHLPQWLEFTPERAKIALAELLSQTEGSFAALERDLQPTWTGLMEPMARLGERLGHLLGWTLHLISVKYSDELQAAYDAVRPDYVQLSNRMAQSRPVYDGMTALQNSPAFEQLDQAQQRILRESIRGMERSGVHLEGTDRERYKAIQDRLSELSNTFQTNLVKEEKDSRVKVSDLAQVAGVPGSVLTMAAQTAVEDGIGEATAEQGPWHFVVNGVNYMAVIQQGKSESLRETFYRAYRQRGTSAEFDNRPVVTEILRLRQESVQLLGFENYASYSVDAKMAGSTAAVWELMSQLESAAKPFAIRERDALEAFMRQSLALPGANLDPWDVAYWSERQQEALYGYDSEALREYFQLPKVLDGLFSLIQSLYGVEIRRVPDGSVPVWDDSVEFFEVLRAAEVIAGFYVDPFARPGEKRGGAWMNDVVGRSRTLAVPGQSSSLPVALFVMNARPPAKGKPGLMSLEEVRTLFHEFGHATQHMFTQIEEGGASGMNLVEWDAVELASQFNEYWMDYKPFLCDLSAHVDSGEPLDDDTLERIISSLNFMSGNATLRQLQFAKFDMVLHERFGLPGGDDGQTPAQMEQQVTKETVVMPMLDDESQLPAFGHLFAGGYAAGYYSYKWAEVLAADAFAAFKEVGLDNKAEIAKIAQRFRDTVLGLGGSLPAAEVYRRFRGRDATPDALLRDQGLLEATG